MAEPGSINSKACEECKRRMSGEMGEDCEDYQEWDGHCVNQSPFEPQAIMSPERWAGEVWSEPE